MNEIIEYIIRFLLYGNEVAAKQVGYTADETTGLNSSNVDIDFVYEAKRRIKEVKIDNVTYETYTLSVTLSTILETVSSALKVCSTCKVLL